jgi:hypothetical protein
MPRFLLDVLRVLCGFSLRTWRLKALSSQRQQAINRKDHPQATERKRDLPLNLIK